MALTNPQKHRMLQLQLNPPTRSNAPHGKQADVVCNDPLLSMVLLPLSSLWLVSLRRGTRRVGRLQLIHCNVDIFPCLGGLSVCWILWIMTMLVEFFVSIWTAVKIRLPELYTWPTRLGVGLAES
jgi:hypothetical protein